MKPLIRRSFSWLAVIAVWVFSGFHGAYGGSLKEQDKNPVIARTSPSPTQPASNEEVERLRLKLQNQLRRGNYREALQTAEAILVLKPDDSWALLQRLLCESRLKKPSPFSEPSPEALRLLEQKLSQEEQQRQKGLARQRALERQLQREQAKWDKEIKELQEAAEQQEQLKRKIAQEEALRSAKEERTLKRAQIQEETLSASGAPAKTPSKAKAPPSQEETPKPSIELAPVRVEGQVAAIPGETTSPSLAGRPHPPAGAVMINARKMSVSPDRRIATAEGDVEVVFENVLLTCDFMTLFTDTKDVYAEGRVRLEEGPQVFRGEMVHYNLNTKKGRFMEGTVSSPPWHEHGRFIESLAEGVYLVKPGYLTSCELEPPHFQFAGRQAIVFSDEGFARVRNATFLVEQFPFIYLPRLTIADRRSPFFFIPGKKKPWEQFLLSGYRYELHRGLENQKGTLKLDWRRAFGWGVGADHQFDDPKAGKGLLKVYYNDERNIRRPEDDLPKGADIRRYRILWRHRLEPFEDTVVLTDIQKYSDVDFRKELLFREEYTQDDNFDSFVSLVTNDPNYSLSLLTRKRINRFQSVTEAFPQATISTRSQPIGDTNLFTNTSATFANLQTKNAHSENDTDVVQGSLRQELSYAWTLFRPIELTPRVAVSQAYHTKDKQGGEERPDGQRDVLVGQASGGLDVSLKLFKVFPVTVNALGLNINWLRHVLTPTLAYQYTHQPTISNSQLNFGLAEAPTNEVTFGLENKLQTKRHRMKKPVTDKDKGDIKSVETPVPAQPSVRSIDLARFLISAPYTFRGNHNKEGGQLGDWTFDLELYPWPWLRLETNWDYPSHFIKGSRDKRLTGWSFDLVAVGGTGEFRAEDAPAIQAPARTAFEPGPLSLTSLLLPRGQWYLGLSHRYSHNDKTEDVVQFDWRLSEKWEIGTYHRIDWKEVIGTSKRFNHAREYQYSLRRDLHDWLAEFVYRVDREFGEEIFFTMTLKAYPEMPLEIEESYHQPKFGSQSSPFSPLHLQ
ncbi:MAG: hypothetical protein HYY57_06545 [Candidatus Omnitrophica bacterium]|nr:hypothetical protein [Candidatus Omnitrophota bacterium]